MRQNILPFVTLCFFTTPLFAQNVAINTDGSAAGASSILDIKSINKGLLIPRMTTAQRTAIAAPAKGLIVFDITTNSFWFYNGTAWSQLSAGSNGWNLTGNAATNPSSNFIGTTDNQPLRFRVNNLWAGEINPTNGNVFFGLGAGKSNTVGQSNTATGVEALLTNTTGNGNTANGFQTLYSNTTGYANTANGAIALYSNTTGVSNTATGWRSLSTNTTGNFNTAYGESALFSNTIGNYNTANGSQALFYNTTGLGNTANGGEALFNNSIGYNNTAVGNLALTANTTGWDNTGIGVTALYSNTTGIENTAIGRQSLFYNTTGSDNTATGYKSLRNNNTGVDNAANGLHALYSNTTGNSNTACGAYALYNNITGNGNTALGWGATALSTGDLYNATAIGFNAIADASNKVRVGNINVTSIGGEVGWTSFSDGRYKKNIKEDVKGLSFINSLRPITYTIDVNALNAYNDKARKHDSTYEKSKVAMKSSADEAAKIVYNGFIAQDVEKAAQSIGYNFSGVDKPPTKDGLYGLRYADFVVPLVKAMQEQQLIIEELKKQMADMKREIELLKNKN